MTFIPVSRSDPYGALFPSWTSLQRASVSTRRRPAADEDDARKALGADQRFPVSVMTDASLEHLARIALG